MSISFSNTLQFLKTLSYFKKLSAKHCKKDYCFKDPKLCLGTKDDCFVKMANSDYTGFLRKELAGMCCISYFFDVFVISHAIQ